MKPCESDHFLKLIALKSIALQALIKSNLAFVVLGGDINGELKTGHQKY